MRKKLLESREQQAVQLEILPPPWGEGKLSCYQKREHVCWRVHHGLEIPPLSPSILSIQPRPLPTQSLTSCSLSIWVRHNSRSLSPGTTMIPSGTAARQGTDTTKGAVHAPSPNPHTAEPRALLDSGTVAPTPWSFSWSLTGFLELFLVIVQCLVVAHADSAHPDPQPLRHWLLAACRGEEKGKGSESDSPLSSYPTHPSKTGKNMDWSGGLGTSSFSSIRVWPYFCDLIPSQTLLEKGSKCLWE